MSPINNEPFVRTITDEDDLFWQDEVTTQNEMVSRMSSAQDRALRPSSSTFISSERRNSTHSRRNSTVAFSNCDISEQVFGMRNATTQPITRQERDVAESGSIASRQSSARSAFDQVLTRVGSAISRISSFRGNLQRTPSTNFLHQDKKFNSKLAKAVRNMSLKVANAKQGHRHLDQKLVNAITGLLDVISSYSTNDEVFTSEENEEIRELFTHILNINQNENTDSERSRIVKRMYDVLISLPLHKSIYLVAGNVIGSFALNNWCGVVKQEHGKQFPRMAVLLQIPAVKAYLTLACVLSHSYDTLSAWMGMTLLCSKYAKAGRKPNRMEINQYKQFAEVLADVHFSTTNSDLYYNIQGSGSQQMADTLREFDRKDLRKSAHEAMKLFATLTGNMENDFYNNGNRWNLNDDQRDCIVQGYLARERDEEIFDRFYEDVLFDVSEKLGAEEGSSPESSRPESLFEKGPMPNIFLEKFKEFFGVEVVQSRGRAGSAASRVSRHSIAEEKEALEGTIIDG